MAAVATAKITATAASLWATGAPGAADAHTEHHALADGEIRRVDKDQKKLTIRHGPIQNLDMPPMTMVFLVKEPAMLDAVKIGDKVKFQADKVGGAYTVTHIERAQARSCSTKPPYSAPKNAFCSRAN